METLTRICRLPLVLALLLGANLALRAQYTLDEIGVDLGAGYNSYLNEAGSLGGPSVKGSIFYSHYFCGKAFGIQGEAGFQGLFSSSGDANALFPVVPESSSIKLNQVQARIGFFLKVRPHDYHRRKEWAFLFGPVLPYSFLNTFKFKGPNGSYSGEMALLEVKQNLAPAIHLSFQLRRPIQKQHYFIQPGIEFTPTSSFSSVEMGFRSFNVFLRFGYAFWEQRG